jgi:hypothetical protein
MLATVDAALAELEQEAVVPEGETSLQLLQAIYRDKAQPLNVRVRCAIESLPYETPKLSASTVVSMDGKSFAEMLDRATARSETVRLPAPRPPVIDAAPVVSAEEMKRPFTSSYRRFARR